MLMREGQCVNDVKSLVIMMQEGTPLVNKAQAQPSNTLFQARLAAAVALRDKIVGLVAACLSPHRQNDA